MSIFQLINLARRYLKQRDAGKRIDPQELKMLRLKSCEIVIAEPIAPSVFDVDRSEEFNRLRIEARRMKEKGPRMEGVRELEMDDEMNVAWHEFKKRFKVLSLPNSVMLRISDGGIGYRMELEIAQEETADDGSLSAFAERAVLRHASEQLLHWWHACYFDETIYTGRAQLSCVRVHGILTPEARERVDAFGFAPVVGRSADGHRVCEYTVYHPYGSGAGILRYRVIEDETEPFGIYRGVVSSVDIPSPAHF